MTGEANKVVYRLKVALDKQFDDQLMQLAEKTSKVIEELDNVKEQADTRFTSYYNRKKWLDYIIFAYIGLTPIFLGLTLWLLLKK